MGAPECQLEILSAGVVCAAGFCAPQVAASLRAGLSRVTDSYLYDRGGEPLTMGLVEIDELPPLGEAFDDPPLGDREARLLRIAAPALAEACAPLRLGTDPVPLLLAVREPALPGEDPAPELALDDLALQSGAPLDIPRSRLLALGRSGGLRALAEARDMVARRPGLALIGGVDSYLDTDLLQALEDQRRLKVGAVQDGFIPGEGAAFLLVGAAGAGARAGIEPIAHAIAIGEGREAGHLYAPDVPHLGDGLAGACRIAVAAASGEKQSRERRAAQGSARAWRGIHTVLAGLNGEAFWAKEWGVTRIRLADDFREPVRIEHPVEIMGDPGAALGPVMLGIAALGLRHGFFEADCLIWCGSDGPERMATILSP